MVAGLSLKRLFDILSSVVIMWGRMLVKICGVDSWDSECSRSSEPPTRDTGIQASGLSQRGMVLKSVHQSRSLTQQGLSGEKLEDKAGA